MLKLMYITNDTRVAQIADRTGVDRIFVDLEYIDKDKRQAGLDTVKNHHTPEDVRRIKDVLTTSQLMARVNPWHEAKASTPTEKGYCSSIEEINQVIEAGADIVMLPYFKTVQEVSKFIEAVDGRATVFPLLETQGAVDHIDDILALEGIDEIHIGINDLCIDQGKKFMFQLLTDGTVEYICKKIEPTGIPYGIGGIAALGRGKLPSDYIIVEHYRLGSTIAILSRSFCNAKDYQTYDAIENQFDIGTKAIRAFEKRLIGSDRSEKFFKDNLAEMTTIVDEIVAGMPERK